MCGRIVQNFSKSDLEEVLSFESNDLEFDSRFNVSPSQSVPVIVKNNDKNIIENMKWGFIPHWANPAKKITPQINARIEGIESKPFFRNSYKKKHCLIPISGFYEWKKEGENKQPYYIHNAEQNIFFLAGIWEEGKENIKTFAIITREANESMKNIHNRMPVIIPNNDSSDFLNCKLKNLNTMQDENNIRSYKVSTLVSSPKNDSPECIKQID